MEIKEFVKSVDYKIDKLFGSRSSTAQNPDATFDQKTADIDSIKVVEKYTGETVYDLIKGEFPLMKFLQDNLDKSTLITSNIDLTYYKNLELRKLSFEDFNVYFFTYVSGVSGNIRVGSVYMNVKRVDLPPKNEIKPAKDSRLYIFRGKEDDKIYKLPFLNYPSNISDFVKWLKKNKKISVTPKEFWNKKDNISNWGEWMKEHYIPKFNLKTQDDIANYIEYLENDYFPKYQPKNKVVLLKNPIEINITQDDIIKFINETNNRYKIYR